MKTKYYLVIKNINGFFYEYTLGYKIHEGRMTRLKKDGTQEEASGDIDIDYVLKKRFVREIPEEEIVFLL